MVHKQGEAKYSYWVSCERFTVRVDTDARGTIVFAAPIVRKFTGQSFRALCSWIQGKVGTITVVDLDEMCYIKSDWKDYREGWR